ncbi:MAG: hypothetical protein ACJ763_11665 [Bdellovibrionia bacterium]
MRFYLGVLFCLIGLSAFIAEKAKASEDIVAVQSVANGNLTTKCEISTVESEGYALQVRVTQDFKELNIGGFVQLWSDDEGLLKLIERAAGASFEESKSAARNYQILYSVFSKGSDGSLIETPIQGYGKRNIESKFPHTQPLIELIDRFCNTDAKAFSDR